MNDLAPIALFVYNRPKHTQSTIDALKNNFLAKDSELYIYSDAAKNPDAQVMVDEVRSMLSKVEGFKKVTIVERDENYGLARSIIVGATSLIKEYGKIIVLEDDLITSPYFLNFMNDSLSVYKERRDIISITGFNFSLDKMSLLRNYIGDVYLNVRPMSWSWATWYEKWKDIDWEVRDYQEFQSDRDSIKRFNKGGTDLANMLDRQMRGKINSWYIRWAYHAYRKGSYTIYPKISYVNNIGHDNTGVHCLADKNGIFSHNELCSKREIVLQKDIQIRQDIVDEFNSKFNLTLNSKIKQYLKKLLGM